MKHDTTYNTLNAIPYGYCHCGCGQKTRLATRSATRRKTVKGQPQQFCKHHYHPAVQPTSVKFWRYITAGAPDVCWEWQGARDDEGYGSLFIRDTHIGAHRAAWELTHGPIPAGQDVLHSCDNRPCCNPSHLFLGSQADNTRDMIAKGRDRHAQGVNHGMAKLMDADIIAIRELYATGQISQTKIAAIYGIHYSMVSLIVRRVNWKHVP